jgi:hypothetical protein
VLETVGSGGVEWLLEGGLPTLVVGSCDAVDSVELDVVDGAVTVKDRAAVHHLVSVPGCVTGIERLQDGRLLMTLYAYGSSPRLDVVGLVP